MESKQKPAVKEKRRNNEKRKEKSRNAARCRRSRESEIFTDLGNALPLSAEQVEQLDKASVMRLAISYLRVRDMLKLVPNVSTKKKNKKVKAEGSVFLKSLEGFVMVLSQDGDFIYLSENISEYLGITQIDLMGQSVYEYSHPCDHDEVKDILSAKVQENTHNPVSCFLRMKCTLTNKGRSVNLKSATYKVIHCTGHMLYTEASPTTDDTSNINKCFIAIGQIIPHPSNIETPLPTQTFLTKHSLDMKFTYADEKMFDFLGYKSEDLMGKSVYEYHHAMDSEFISSAYKCLFSKGQCETIRYRFLGKMGGYVWVATQGTLIYDKNNKPYSVVCVNYVISGIECADDIYAAFQLNATIKSEDDHQVDDLELLTPPLSENSSPRSASSTPGIDSDLPLVVPTLPATTRERDSKPITVTDKIFADIAIPSPISSRPQSTTTKHFNPRTEDMSKGFVMFSKEEPGLTLMKDDNLDDLTHLAPVAGDVCIPLDDYFSSDMYLLNHEHLIHNYSPLLTDEPADPFMDSCDTSPQILSPNMSKNSESSLHSLNSPTESALGDDEMFLSMGDEADLLLKAPYIPMSMSDDLPLFMPDGFGLSNGSPFCTDKDGVVSKDVDNSSSLSELLQAGVTKGTGCVKSGDTGGGGRGRNITASDDYCNTIKTNWTNLHLNKPPPTPTTTIPEPHTQSRTNQKSTNRSTTNTNKRLSNTKYTTPNKRTKADLHASITRQGTGSKGKDPAKMTNQLLEQLINVQNKNRSVDWLREERVGRKAACVVSQPSDSVLMNLLPEQLEISCSRKKEPPSTTSQKVSDKGVSRDLPPLLYPLHIAYALMDSEDSRDDNITNCHRNVQQREECAARVNTIRKNSFSLLDPEMEIIPSLLDLTEQDYEVNAPVNSQLLQCSMSPELNGNPPIVTKRKKHLEKKHSSTSLISDPSNANMFSFTHQGNSSNSLLNPIYDQPSTLYPIINYPILHEPMSLPLYGTTMRNVPSTNPFATNIHPQYHNPNLKLPPLFADSNECKSLPIFEQTDDVLKRRFSDPGLPNDSDSSLNSYEGKLIQKLTQQMHGLKESNRKLSRDLTEMRLEMNLMKQQIHSRHYEREYEPGMLADVIREVRDAARVREDVLLSRVKHMIEEKQMTINQINHLSEKNRHTDRLSKLEDQMKLLTSNHHPSSEDNIFVATLPSATTIEDNTSAARQVLELERETLLLRRELQDARAKKDESDHKILQLDKQLFAFLRGVGPTNLEKDIPDDSKSNSDTSTAVQQDYSSPTVTPSTSNSHSSSSPSQRIILSGPVTDL